MKSLILINGKGDKYNLLDVSLSPTFQIKGLGFEEDSDFMRIGKRYVPVDDKLEQGKLTLGLLFWNTADQNYKTFVKTARRNPLTIMYENDSGVYYIPCRLVSIEKIDRLRYNMYGCPVTFAMTGNPYRIVSDFNKGETGLGKNYGSVGYTYDYTYENDILNTVIINSDSLVESDCIITIYGAVTNPVWRHYIDGIFYESGAYTGTIPEGHSLVIDSHSVPYSIIEYDSSGNVVADRYALCDFSTERFMKVNEGNNRYSVSQDNVDAVNLKVEAYIEYETV